MKMRIGITTDIVDSSKYHKGVSYYIQYLVKNLAKVSEDEIYLIHSRNSDSEIYKLGLREIIISGSSSEFLKVLSNVSGRRFLKKMDVIHTTAPRIPYFPFYSIPNVKKILTVHGLDLYIPDRWKARFCRTPRGWVQQRALSLLFSKNRDNIDAFIAISNFLKRELTTHLKIPGEKIHVVYHGVDTKFKPLDIERQKIIISDTPLPEIVEIYYKLRKRGINHELVIFTKRGYGERAKHLVNHLNLQKYVHFAGHLPQEELIKLYNLAEVFVHLAGYESFGLTSLEAMACGCPVVVTNVGSLPEVISDAGVLLDFIDVEGFVDAVYEILTNKGVWDEMHKKGLKRAKKFSWEKTARETLQVYKHVFGE